MSNIVIAILFRCLFHFSEQVGLEPIIRPTVNFEDKDDLVLKLANIHANFAGTTVCKVTNKELFLELCTPHKRALYGSVWDQLVAVGIKKSDSVINAFIKLEKKAFKDGLVAPRLIYPRNPRYVVELAKYLKQIEHSTFQSIDILFEELFSMSSVVMKGKNAKQRGDLISKKWAKFANPVAVGFDMTHFDKHVSVEALKMEHSYYKTLFGDNAELTTLLNWQLSNKIVGYSDDNKTVRFVKEGGRMSGDINTSLGNVLIVTLLSADYFRKNKGFKQIEFINDGDDSVVILEKEDLEKLDNIGDYFKAHGFIMRLEDPIDVLEKLVFCQCQPVFNSAHDSYVMVRQLDAALMKDSCCLIKCDTPNKYYTWRSEVGLAGQIMTAGLPVYYSYYGIMLRNIKLKQLDTQMVNHYQGSGMARMAYNMKKVEHVISDESRISFFKAFDIPPYMQIELEKSFDEQTPLSFGTKVGPEDWSDIFNIRY